MPYVRNEDGVVVYRHAFNLKPDDKPLQFKNGQWVADNQNYPAHQPKPKKKPKAIWERLDAMAARYGAAQKPEPPPAEVPPKPADPYPGAVPVNHGAYAYANNVVYNAPAAGGGGGAGMGGVGILQQAEPDAAFARQQMQWAWQQINKPAQVIKPIRDYDFEAEDDWYNPAQEKVKEPMAKLNLERMIQEGEKKYYVFLFNDLYHDPKKLERLLQDEACHYRHLLPSHATGYRLYESKGYPFLVRDENAGAVFGCIYEVNDAAFKVLERREKIGPVRRGKVSTNYYHGKCWGFHTTKQDLPPDAKVMKEVDYKKYVESILDVGEEE